MKKNHVLIVDDNAGIRSLIHTTLGETFYRLGEAANGQQVLDYLAQNDFPDLIILDMAMPGMTGLEVLEILRDDPETYPIEVVVLSANASQDMQDAALELGAVAVLRKPFSPLELLQLVEGLFNA